MASIPLRPENPLRPASQDSTAGTPAGGAGLDLPGGEAHSQIGDEGVLRLSRPVAGHDAPARGLGVAHLHHRGTGQARQTPLKLAVQDAALLAYKDCDMPWLAHMYLHSIMHIYVLAV